MKGLMRQSQVLCIVPARGRSRGLPDKNLQRVGGTTLVGHAVHAAMRYAALEDAVVNVLVDTDSSAIADEGRRWGATVPFLRPAHLATDTAPVVEATLHLMDRLERIGQHHDVVILLQPTSPLRKLSDIQRCAQPVLEGDAASTVSVTTLEHPLAHTLRIADDDTLHWAVSAPPVRRQEAPVLYRPSGSVYVATTAQLREHRAFVVEGRTRTVKVPSYRSVDIDTPEHLSSADSLMRAREAEGDPGPRLPFGSDASCLIIAEAGVNHNGDLDVAMRLVETAARAGADAVKFQSFDPDQLAGAGAQKAAYQQRLTGSNEDQRAMLRRLALPDDAFRKLRDHASRHGIEFLSSPFGIDSAIMLRDLGVSALKVPSGELTNLPLLESLAKLGLPLLVSTGMADMAEVGRAVRAIERNGDPPVALLHCVSDYPADPADCNLDAMASLLATFGLPVGWSDHTTGISIALAACALGARIIEKHFTLDRGLPGPDHAASLEPDELEDLVREVRRVAASRGDGIKRPTSAERDTARAARRSLHLARDVTAGHVLGSADFAMLRPGTGISPSRLQEVVGRPVLRGLPAGHLLSESDLG